MVVWSAIQSALRKTFSGIDAETDVLAARVDCHSCDQKESCHNGFDTSLKSKNKICENQEQQSKKLT
jgi:hypothetical protein